MAISPQDAIKKFKVELLQELPLDDPIFFAMAERSNLFPMDTGNTIRAEKSRAHKVDYFLRQVVEPGAEDYLPRLLQVMKESKVANVEKLADDIQKAVAPDSPSCSPPQSKRRKLVHCTELSDYQEHVKQIYVNTRYSIQRDMWQLLHPKHFVNALLIRHIGCTKEREIVDVITIMKYGLTSNKNILDGNDKANTLSLLETHTKADRSIQTNEISDIFQQFDTKEGNATIPNFILIEGAPGMGKTTLCKEIAYQWAKQCLLKDTKLLILIYLRDPAISKIIHLKDLIHYSYNFDEGAIQCSQECAKVLNNSESNDLTIVFDGFDEFDSSSDSLIANILYRKVLPQCRIVVTSRLTASNRLHRLADVRVEVLGFTDESKIQYIKQELKDHPDKIEALQSYLDEHASINSICYMPMMMTILVYIFKENENLPNNSTET